jgi:hypothetical protein
VRSEPVRDESINSGVDRGIDDAPTCDPRADDTERSALASPANGDRLVAAPADGAAAIAGAPMTARKRAMRSATDRPADAPDDLTTPSARRQGPTPTA